MFRSGLRPKSSGFRVLVLLLVSLAAGRANALTRSFTDTVNGATADYSVWLPDDVSTVRGLIFSLPGSMGSTTDGVGFSGAQNPARALGFGCMGVGIRNREVVYFDWSRDPAALTRAMNKAATLTGHPELVNAPVALTGWSGGGYQTVLLAKVAASRVVAAAYGGQVTNNYSSDVNMAQIPTLMVGGSNDYADPYWSSPGGIEGNFEYRRTNFNAQAAFGVDWGAPHDAGINQGNQAFNYWMSEVVRQRYPFGVNPSTVPGNPVALRTLDITSGWLGNTTKFSTSDYHTPTVTSPFTYVAPYGSYVGNKNTASWLPTKDAAFVFRAFTSVDNPAKVSVRTLMPFQTELKFYATDGRGLGPQGEGPYGMGVDIPVNSSLQVDVDRRNFAIDAGNRVVRVDFYDGSQPMGSLTAPNAGSRYRFTFTPTWMGTHGLVAVATDAFGNQTSTFCEAAVYGPIPEPATLALLTVGGLALVRRRRA